MYNDEDDLVAQKDIARYKKTANMLKLAFNMATRPNGVTLKEIEDEFGVKRRTAERMRDCLLYTFPEQVEELYIENNDSNVKHWGFTSSSFLSPAVSFTSDEVLNLERLEKMAQTEEIKKNLQDTIGKLRIIFKKSCSSMESRIESILRTEGYAVRQSPGFKIDLNTLNKIREAMDCSRPLLAKYHGKERKLEPLGIIYAEKTYLVARERKKGNGIYYYFLHKLENLRMSLIETYEKEDFDLQEYVNRSFGIYQSEIMDVKLSFAPDLAEEASVYNFHPTQKGKWEKDGSYTVTFKASGEREIMWHIFKWGKGCRILAPKHLKEGYKKYLTECLENNK